MELNKFIKVCVVYFIYIYICVYMIQNMLLTICLGHIKVLERFMILCKIKCILSSLENKLCD